MDKFWRKTIITDLDKDLPKSTPTDTFTPRVVLSEDKKRKLLDFLATNHSHSEMTQWAVCKSCQERMAKYKHEKSKLTQEELQDLYQFVRQRAKEIYQLPQRQQQAIQEQIRQINHEQVK